MNGTTTTEVQRVLDGDKEAFKEIIAANQRLVFHVVRRLVGNLADAEDICQDVFVKVYRNLSKFKYESKLSTWIAKIAYNTAINFLEKKKVPLFDDNSPCEITLDDVAGAEPGPDETTQGSDISSRLHVMIGQLPVQYRSILTLYHLEDLSYKEIGKILGLPEGTVKSYLFRARKMLKERLISNYQIEEIYQ